MYMKETKCLRRTEQGTKRVVITAAFFKEVYIYKLREAAKKVLFFSGPATNRGTGEGPGHLKKIPF